MRALVRPNARALDVDPGPHADVVARRLRTEVRDGFVEQRRVVTAVVNDGVAVLPCNPDVIGKLAGLDQVATPHLDAIQMEVCRDRVQRALHHEARVRPARPAIRRCRRRVGVHVAKAHAVVRYPVRPGHLGSADDRQDDAVGRVCAAVVDEVVAQRQHPTLGVETDLDLVHLSPLLVHGGEMLLAVLGPLDRPAELHRRVRDEELVGIEEHDLRPEAAAHVGRDDLDVRLGEAKQDGEAAADRGRRLRRVVDHELAIAGRPSGPHRATLHRARGGAFVAELQSLAVWRFAQRLLHVADFLQHLRGDVAGHVVVHQVLGSR